MSSAQGIFHSVVLANYNGVEFVEQAIRSVLAQEQANFELIVVDDGSTDGSLAVIESLAECYPEIIKVLRHERNRGQGAGFNTGFAASRGSLVSFLDSDDLWYPDKLRHVAEAFDHFPDAVMHHHNLEILRNGVVLPERVVDMMAFGDVGARWRKTKGNPHFLPRFAPTSGLTLPRRILELILPCPEVRVCADMWLTFAPLAFGPVSASYDAKGAYRIHGANNFYGGKVDFWGLLLNELGPPMRALWKRHGVVDVLPPPSIPAPAPVPKALKDRLLDLSIRKLLHGVRGKFSFSRP
jgi:glycosyltransferase involved in cell wall biosynthesis